MYSNLHFSKLVLENQKPVFVDPKKQTLGYGFQCVQDIDSGVDGSLWSLSCNANKDGNFDVLKWDPFKLQWYKVGGASGIKIAVFNEVSAAVLDKQGRIFISSDTGAQEQTQWVDSVQDERSYLKDSTLLATKEDKDFVRSLFIKDYNVATLCYRGSRDGQDGKTFHKNCDNRGATISIIKATTGKVFGGFASIPWKSSDAY